MSLADETVFSKLNSLNDTQEGIVSIASWVMFHRRHAKRFAELWLERLKESSASRRLNLIYLANEVVQQMKIRKKEDFSQAFSPIIGEACEVTYRQSPSDIQNKLRRVVAVWRQRMIFDNEVLANIEQRLDDLDKGKSSGGGMRRLGGLGGGSIPPELTKVVNSQQRLSTKLTNSTLNFGIATEEYTKQMEADAIPTAPVYAARLSSLLKTLDTAHGAVKDAMVSREELIKGLEALLETNKAALAGEQAQLKELQAKQIKTDDMKKDVENMILSGLNAGQYEDANGDSNMRSTTPDIEPPAVEALTPPPTAADEPMQQDSGPFALSQSPTTTTAPLLAGSDLLSSMLTSQAYGAFNNGIRAVSPPNKADNPMAGLEGLDDDLVAMFRKQAEKAGTMHNGISHATNPMQQLNADDDDEYHP